MLNILHCQETEILFIRNLLIELFDVKFGRPIKLYEDNSGAVTIAKYGNFTKNSKHIEVQHHYINENYKFEFSRYVDKES